MLPAIGDYKLLQHHLRVWFRASQHSARSATTNIGLNHLQTNDYIGVLFQDQRHFFGTALTQLCISIADKTSLIAAFSSRRRRLSCWWQQRRPVPNQRIRAATWYLFVSFLSFSRHRIDSQDAQDWKLIGRKDARERHQESQEWTGRSEGGRLSSLEIYICWWWAMLSEPRWGFLRDTIVSA